MTFNRGMISTHYNCIFILVLITLKMTTLVTKICWWLFSYLLHGAECFLWS